MAHKLSGVRVLSELANEMRDGIVALAGERNWKETRARWLERAARAAGISYRTARAIFYGEIRDPRGSVVERVRCALGEKAREAKPRDEFDLFKERLSALEARLLSIDPEFYREGINALRNATREIRRSVNPDGDSDCADTS